MASAEYASLHLAPHRQPHNTPPATTQFFLQAGCPSCCPTNSVKALEASAVHKLLTKISKASRARQKHLAGGILACGAYVGHLWSTHYSAESLSWYSRERRKHAWTPGSRQIRFMTAPNSALRTISSVLPATVNNCLASLYQSTIHVSILIIKAVKISD